MRITQCYCLHVSFSWTSIKFYLSWTNPCDWRWPPRHRHPPPFYNCLWWSVGYSLLMSTQLCRTEYSNFQSTVKVKTWVKTIFSFCKEFISYFLELGKLFDSLRRLYTFNPISVGWQMLFSVWRPKGSPGTRAKCLLAAASL